MRDANQPTFNVQEFLIQVAEGKADIADIPKPQPIPEPKTRPTRKPRKRAATAAAAD
jgi:hypothetical protein